MKKTSFSKKRYTHFKWGYVRTLSKEIRDVSGRIPFKSAAIFTLIILLVLALHHPLILFELPDRTNERILDKLGFDLLGATGFTGLRRNVLKFEDSVTPFFNLFGHYPDLPLYSFQLSANDIRRFNNWMDWLEESKENETARFRSVKLDYNGEKINVKFALHGDDYINFINRKKTFQIKFEKDRYINGSRKWIFFIPSERGYLTPFLSSYLAKELEMPALKYDLVEVKLNGVPQGTYIMGEKETEEFLEREGMANTVILKLTDNWIDDLPDKYSVGLLYGTSHNTPFDLEISNLDEIKLDEYDGRVVKFQAKRFFDAIKTGNQKGLIELLDIEKVAKFEAWRTVLGNSHDATGDNIRMIYHLDNGKFSFLLRNEAILNKLQLKRGGFENKLARYTYSTYLVPLLVEVGKIDIVRHRRNQELFRIVNNPEIIPYYSDLVEEYKNSFSKDRTNEYPSLEIEYLLDKSVSTLGYNLDVIRAYLNYSKCYINIVNEPGKITLEITPNSHVAINFDKFDLIFDEEVRNGILIDKNAEKRYRVNGKIISIEGILNNQLIQPRLNDNLLVERTTFTYELILPKTDNSLIDTVIEARNSITNSSIPPDDLYVATATGTSYYHIPALDEIVGYYPEINFSLNAENEIIWGPEDYVIERDVIIPPETRLIIKAGTRIEMKKDRSIVSYSPVEIQGTEDEPVIISALNESEPFGVFGVVGTGKEKSRINNLIIHGGNDAWVNGIFFSGALSIYYNDVELRNSIIKENNADDGLNIKHSKVSIEDNVFKNNFADQFDCDFCTGLIQNNIFDDMEGENENGDGLDISGSTILAKNNVFKNHKDKGVSIGEESRIVLIKNKIINNNLGIVIKDLSRAYILENELEGNEIAISGYLKKQIFGAGTGFIYNTTLIGNGKDFELDEKSRLFELTDIPISYNEMDDPINLIEALELITNDEINQS